MNHKVDARSATEDILQRYFSKRSAIDMPFEVKIDTDLPTERVGIEPEWAYLIGSIYFSDFSQSTVLTLTVEGEKHPKTRPDEEEKSKMAELQEKMSRDPKSLTLAENLYFWHPPSQYFNQTEIIRPSRYPLSKKIDMGKGILVWPDTTLTISVAPIQPGWIGLAGMKFYYPAVSLEKRL